MMRGAHDLRELLRGEGFMAMLSTASLSASLSGRSMQLRACSSSPGGTWDSRLTASCLCSTPAAGCRIRRHCMIKSQWHCKRSGMMVSRDSVLAHASKLANCQLPTRSAATPA